MPEASIVIKATDRFSDAMKTMRDDLADDLVMMGVDVSADEPLQTLVPKVLLILEESNF